MNLVFSENSDLQVVFIIIPLKEAVLHMLTLEAKDLVQTYVLHGAEDVSFNVRISLLKFFYEMLGFKPL